MTSPFEGPEKLLEIWFAPSPNALPSLAAIPADGKTGLRKVSRESWVQMLAIVQCKVLSYIQGEELDAFLLSESSLFVSPHKVILKTCGTTLNLLGLPHILEIARNEASLPFVYRIFYSRKSFMFPERQPGPHRDWRDEVRYLDNIFRNGAAYTVGKMNGDHWLLYMAPEQEGFSSFSAASSNPTSSLWTPPSILTRDYTIEILMTQLPQKTRSPFIISESEASNIDPFTHALSLSQRLGITEIFPPHLTHLDAYSFDPCGYSSNALITWQDIGNSLQSGEGYYTIHVTPEVVGSYASFECNVPLTSSNITTPHDIPDLETLVQRVVNIFQPGKLSLTLFISSTADDISHYEGESKVEQAQRAFKRALCGTCSNGLSVVPYERTDKINYEFGGYDLAFATFECSGERLT